jgi:uncharacterized protein
MKKIILAALFCWWLHQEAMAQETEKVHKLESNIRQYFFVMLLKGPHRDQDSITQRRIQDGHMANINRLYKAGKLKVAGPFGDNGDWVGIFIFDCATREEVEDLLKTDPAVQAGRLKGEIHPWWTSAQGSFAPGIPKNP